MGKLVVGRSMSSGGILHLLSSQIRLKVEELSGVSRELPRGGKKSDASAGSPPLDQLRISLKPGAGADLHADSSLEAAMPRGPQYVRMMPHSPWTTLSRCIMHGLCCTCVQHLMWLVVGVSALPCADDPEQLPLGGGPGEYACPHGALDWSGMMPRAASSSSSPLHTGAFVWSGAIAICFPVLA